MESSSFLIFLRSGQWSRAGCHTELADDLDSSEPYVVNCTCYHLSTFAVLVDEIDLEVRNSLPYWFIVIYILIHWKCAKQIWWWKVHKWSLVLFWFQIIPEPSFLEELVTYIGFVISLILLFVALFLLSCIRGRPTNSNSIHKNIVLCVLCGELVYFVALKLRRDLIVLEVSFFYLSILSNRSRIIPIDYYRVTSLVLASVLSSGHTPVKATSSP